MGRDKSLLPFHGITLGESVAETVRAAAGSTVLVGRSGEGAIPDLYPGEGPLGGILTALTHSRAEWNLIVACDMPLVAGDFLRQLLDAAECTDCDALLPTGPGGRLEPLCAVYHRNSRTGLAAAFGKGVRKIAAALAEVRTATLPVAEVSYFQNVNTPEDWAPYER